jgi:nitrite reductase (NO-forming)
MDYPLVTKLKSWAILLVGGPLIVGGLYLASQEPSSTAEREIGGEQRSVNPQVVEQALSNSPTDSQQPQHSPAAPPSAEEAAPAKASAPEDSASLSDAPMPPQMQHGSQQAQAEPSAISVAGIAGNPAKGEQVFRKCRACHSIEPGKNTLGPSLAGVFGRRAGEVPKYNYSPVLKNSSVTWDAVALDAYVHDPKAFLPGNKMSFPGLKSEEERADVIAYLASQSGQQAQAAQPGDQPQPAMQPPSAQAAQQESSVQPSPRQQTQQQPPQQTPAQQQVQTVQQTGEQQDQTSAPAASGQQPAQPGSPQAEQPPASYIPDVRYTLRSGIAEGRMVFIGVGGTIDAKVNPVLAAAQGQVVQITLLNGEGAEHDVVFPDFNAKSPRIVGRGSSTTLVFRADRIGDFLYICSVPGHQLAGMEGQFLVSPRPAAPALVEADISQNPTEVPARIDKREPQRIKVDLHTIEIEGRLAEGTTFGYWTFNGRVPGPMLRVRVGDTLEVHLKNGEDSGLIHSVDFHAATGPGGGAAATQAEPGQEKSFTFKALVPGLYVYHCATPMVAHHIANGMYGLILVEPENGLPPVDREFYVMQGEIYTQAEFGQQGPQEFSVEKLLNERPEYFVFNGAVGALSKIHTLKAKVGETVRIYFGVGGPNYTSSFHVIGEIFDRVYNLADVLSPPARGIQTVTVPAGGATIVEFKLDVPGRYILVDHALSRAERGLIGILQAEGAPNPEVFEGQVDTTAGH